MLASDVRVNSISTSSDCWKQIKLIENDYRNYLGGSSAWNSGKQVHLKQSAISKINAIEARAYKLTDDTE
jgi:hypothetical protein